MGNSKVLTDKGLSSHAQCLEFKDIQLAAGGIFTEMLINVHNWDSKNKSDVIL